MQREKIDSLKNLSMYNEISYFPWDIVTLVNVQPTAQDRSVMLNKNILPYDICKNIINKFTTIYSSPLISGPLIMYVSVFQQNCQRKHPEYRGTDSVVTTACHRVLSENLY